MRFANLLIIASTCLLFNCEPAERENTQEAVAEEPAGKEQDLSPAQALLNQSIAYHDPEGKWPVFAAHIRQESRMLRPTDDTTQIRTRNIRLDNSYAHFSMVQEVDGHTLIRSVTGDSVCHSLYRKKDLNEADSARLSLNCKTAESMRNYFRYLIGLPMVLQDEGTLVTEETGEEELFGHTYKTVTVNYLPEGEEPEWTFFIDSTDYHLAAARFVKADSTGEYILFSNTREQNGIKHFGTFNWYYLDKKPLAEETYVFE